MATTTKKAKTDTREFAICFDAKTGAIHTSECNHFQRYVAAGSKWSAWRSPFGSLANAEAEVTKEERAIYHCKACQPNEKPAAVAQRAQEKPKTKAQGKPKAKSTKS